MKARDTFQRFGWGSQGRLRRHPLVAGILVLVLVAQIGCASSGAKKGLALAPPPALPKDAVLHVAVTSGRFAPEFEIVGSPGGAAKGALEGFFAPLQLLQVPGAILLLPVIVLLMPLSLVAGAETEPGVEIPHEMVATLNIVQDELRDRVAAIGRLRTRHTFTVFADRGPTAIADQPDYRSLSQEGIQTVLEVVVESVTLSGYCGDTEPVTMSVIARNRWIRTAANTATYASEFTYTDAIELCRAGWINSQTTIRNKLHQAYSDIAEKTIREIFLHTESN